MPRTSKYTPELVEQIIRLIEAGTYAVEACMVGGIREETYYKWLRTKPELSESIKKARAKAISVRLMRIDKAGRDGYWQADAWWLERVARDRFGRNPPPKKPNHTNITLGFEPKSAFIHPEETY